METFFQDIRHGLRVFFRSPLLMITIVLTLGLGIGANTAIFSLVNAVMLRPLPVKNPQELVVVGDPALVKLRADGSPPRTDIYSYPLYRDFRDSQTVFSGMLVSGEVNRVRVAKPGTGTQAIPITDQALASLVSGNYFSVLGVNPYLGRTLTQEDDDVPDAHPLAVVSYGFWTEKLGRDPAAIGSTLLLNRYPFTLIGVAQPGFFGDTIGDRQDIWVPVTMQAALLPGRPWLKSYSASFLHIIARLKPGVTMNQAAANMNLIFQQQVAGPLAAKFPGLDRQAITNLHVEVTEGSRGFSLVRGRYKQPLFLLVGIVGLVLLIACVNVANLLLVRALGRQKEVAVRLAIGAPRIRIIRQLLTESILLALAGGAMGIAVAYWGTGVLLQMSRTTGTEATIDLNVLGFTLGVSLLTGILFGIVPAVRSLDVALTSALRSKTEGTGKFRYGPFHWNWGKVLATGQVALSVAVLFAASLLVRSMQKLRDVDLGYNQENLVLLRTDPLSAGYKAFEQRVNYANQMASRLAGLPGVQAVTFSKNGLFSGSDSSDQIKVENFIPRKDADLQAPTERVGANYFSILKIPMISGREIGAQDLESTHRVAVINDEMARFYFGSSDPIGRKITIDDPTLKNPTMEIVGVAGNARDQALRGKVPRRFYVPLSQSEDPTGELHFILKTSGNPEPIIEMARKEIKGFDANIPIISTRTLTLAVDESINGEILIAKLSGFFGIVALLLASVGLYGVMSYIVTRKTRSVGVRMALGAQRIDVLFMVLWEALTLVVIGIVVGVPVALVAGHMFSSMLFGLSSTDPAAMSIVIALLGTVALVASYIPARRATRVDPIIALRDE
ncbi:MAG: ABC transporter permease [Acidobacteriia bacterium]|nr:ABC transporter permease [Terriglobia bacterium]